MKRDAATAELSREELEAEVAALRSENAQLRTAPLPPLNPLPPLAPLPAFDPLASPPASPAVLGANWGGGVAPVRAPPRRALHRGRARDGAGLARAQRRAGSDERAKAAFLPRSRS